MSIGETVIVKGVIASVEGYKSPVILVAKCEIKEVVHIAPKVGDIVKNNGVIGVVTVFDVSQLAFTVDGKSAKFSELTWPTVEELKEYNKKKLQAFTEDELFSEILRRKDEKRKNEIICVYSN